MRELNIENSYVRKFYEEEFFFVPVSKLEHSFRNRDLSAAFDVWNNHDLDTHKDTISSGLNIFTELFGFNSMIFTPPAMYYNPSLEKVLVAGNIEWLDVGRLFKVPMKDATEKWQLNYLGKKNKSGLKVLVRNAVFETNISEYDNGVTKCLKDIEMAFKNNQAAIISNHRASFAGRLYPENRDRGLNSLDELLGKIMNNWHNVEFISGPDFVNLYR
jgi:hypothetical protein